MFNSYLAYKYGASDKFIMISNNMPNYYKEYVFEPLYDCYTLDELIVITTYMKGLSK